jgi:hypothetical protein
MTRRTNARIAGFTLLFYIAVGVAGMILSGRASGAGGIAERLASMVQHETEVRVSAVLGLLTGFVALTLAWRSTRSRASRIAILRCWP